MEEQLIHKQKRRLFFGFLLAFALIFSLLGVLVFQVINFNLYASTDERLNEAVQSETTITREISFSNDSQNDLPEEMPNLGPSAQEKPADNQKPGDFQQIVILRTATGTILNEEALGVRYNELQQVQFDPQNLDEITSVTVENQDGTTHHFHQLTVEKTNSQVSELAYLQVLINTDQLQESMNSFKITLLIAMAIAFLVSVFLSLALTNRALKPVLKSWDKQQAFVANASHELRTPLAVMQSQLEALFLTPEKTVVEASEPIATTLSEIRRLTKLSNDLLLLARFDAKQSFSQKKSVDIADFLENITEPYTELAASLGKQLVIDNSAFEKVLVDPEQMQQVLLILLDNALKFTGTDGKIVITSRVTDKYWQLSVADNGVGFDEKDQEKIFERFYREDTARTTKGSGLGLSIAKMIIESHGGKLVAKKNQGKGAIFSWQIPLRF